MSAKVSDKGGATSAKQGIGVIVPFDFILDDELWAFVPNGVTLHMTRTPAEKGPIDASLASAVGKESAIATATASLIAAGPAVVAFACTSGSYVRGVAGERALCRAMMRAGAPQALTTSGALVEALRSLGTTRVGVATPHNQALAGLLVDFLVEVGITVTSVAYLGLESDIGSVSESALDDLARAADHHDAEAVFLSCTNLRTFRSIPRLEHRLGKPVLTANQVTMWDALRRMGAASDKPLRLRK